MFTWLSENAGTIGVAALVAALAGAAVMQLRRDRKRGRSSCSCSCGSCPMSGTCHKKQ